ncbi:MAG: four helix bundle protein [Patescibacteria group bacterium]
MDKLPKYDLEERTAKFAENMIDLVRPIKQDAVNRRIIDQLVGCSGSVGANYSEAVEAESKKDFTHKIGICRKEAKEVRHWMRLLAKANPEKANEIRVLWKEAHEFVLIFSKIVRSARGKL